jgi:predicted Holliday junction resolvase-like endonuclease
MLLFISLKNILFILGVILLLRFIGKMMTARRNINEQKKHQKEHTNQEVQRDNSERNIGKTSIQKIDKSKISESKYTNFEEVD